ncbi:PAS domain S-box protein [Mariprofundus erugo]|uniref:Sensor protein FixL n=1 Tax=Mariprofundus erugo TaxID=2528639 RepID=A0A5R9GIB7_9PROT|nr:PAS domain S-box protein [Mariprofundus erugo]TLS66481.1 PAS domain S-box protein [Mariprofundus erugo]
MEKLTGHRIILLMLIMAAIVAIVLGISMRQLFVTAVEQQRLRLVETVKSQSELMQSIARFDLQYNSNYQPGGPREATLGQILAAFQHLPRISKTFELVLARKDGDKITFLATRTSRGLMPDFTIPVASRFAEAMQRALAGGSGSLIGLDYQGRRVLAAYEYVPALQLGIVAKIDLSEIQQPFFESIGESVIVAFVFIILGAWLFYYVGFPLVRKLIESKTSYRELSEALQQANLKLEEKVLERTMDLELGQKRMQETLTWNEALMDAAADCIVTVNEHGVIESFNQSGEAMFGYRSADVVGQRINMLMPPAVAADHDGYMRHYMERGVSRLLGHSREMSAMRKNGDIFPVELNVREVRVGQSRRYIGIIRDITVLKQSKQALVDAEAHSRLLLESVVEGIYGLDCDGRTTFVNSAAARMLGYEPAELIGLSMHEMVHHSYADGSAYQWQACPMYTLITDGRTHHVRDEVLWRKDGSCFPVQYSGTPMYKDGQVVGAVITFRDISSEKAAKDALDKEYRFSQRLVKTIPSILISTDAERRVTLWNQAAESVFAIPAEHAIGRHVMACGVKCDWRAIAKAVARCRKKGNARLDNFKFSRMDGSEGFLGLSFSPIIENGHISGYMLLGSDITDRIMLQNRLQLSQKMEAIGELAAGIAHEINTPLQYVGDNVRFLRDSFADMVGVCKQYGQLKHECALQGCAQEVIAALEQCEEEADITFLMDEIPAALDQSLDGIEKAANIVRAMKEFSHPGQKDTALSDINRMLENTLTVARNEWKYVAEVHTDFDENLPLLMCLPELNQVFLNLIVNAAHAIAAKIGPQHAEKGDITVRTSCDERVVRIEISDTGTGVPEHLKHKIFEPFFTTKEVGKGTGQGLAIVHNIVVDKHKGAVDLTSVEGRGTTFIVSLPINEEMPIG